MAIDTTDDMVGSILRSGGNSFRVNGMGANTPRPAPIAPAGRREDVSRGGRQGAAMQAQRDHAEADAEGPGGTRASAKGPKRRRLSTSVTVDSSDVDWLREERIRRRVEGEDGPYSFSGILKQALDASLEIADGGGGILDCVKLASGDEVVRMAMAMDLDTWVRLTRTIDGYRSDGVSPQLTRLSCFVRKGLELIRS